MCNIRLEQPVDQAAIENLLDRAFGPGRLALSAYRLRENNAALANLGHVATDGDRLVGSIQFWPIRIGDRSALLLGPLVVEPDLHGTGIGLRLLKAGIEACCAGGHEIVILVGDAPYYARVGFEVLAKGQITFPGPVDTNRLLGLSLNEVSLDRLTGPVRAVAQ